ncbi:unnamed protein product [Vitrella brassicaformis CCMP3155]|uniref:Uncharacterized protein n=1 Tax=Vitrella brassicaformis (strain CCMP3155) TaxID=1169540 RepID=A0A0G4G534_VITBC|nr:unnamed protein product [Vitrella brassicaformis CCMP3155]|eukprot:CEM23431.1 unnamed protein product [Vitrella brassicaformis CCMP3155]
MKRGFLLPKDKQRIPVRNQHDEASPSSTAAVFRAIRLQHWGGIALPRELHVGVYAFVTPVWCLKPPLPSPLSGAVLQHHTELVIDSSNTRQRRFWGSMTPQTAYELGKQMINLKCLIHRFPQTPDGAEGIAAGHHYVANGWCRGLVIALVEGHVAGRQAAREKERPGTTMAVGSLRSLTFKAVVLPGSGPREIAQLADINSNPPAAAPSQSISLPALTDVKGVRRGHVVIEGRGWSMPAVERVIVRYPGAELPDIRPFVATTRSLIDLFVVLVPPSQLAELLELIPVGQQGGPGPLARFQNMNYIKLYEIESIAICRDGLSRLQKCLVDRGCLKSLRFLRIEVHRSDCHWLLLNDYATFKALASLIDATCSPLSEVKCYVCPSGGEIRDIPLTHLLAYTRFGKLPDCGPQLLSALLTCYNVRMKPQRRPPGSPSVESCIQGTPPSAYHYAWTVTQDQVTRPYNGPIDKSLVGNLSLGACGVPSSSGFSMSIECEQGWTPLADAIPPEPPEFKAFKADGLVRVKSLTVKSRIGLGVAKMLLRRGPELEDMQLMDMAPSDVLSLLRCAFVWKTPEKLALERLHQEGGWQTEISLGIQQRFQKVKTLCVKGEVAACFAAATMPHMSAIREFTICANETEARQALVNGSGATIPRLSLGGASDGRQDLIKAEDERDGLTLGDWKDELPHINTLVMHLDVPSADVVDPGVFILSSIWSVLEIESISVLRLVLPHRSHLDALNKAIERRFSEIEGNVYSVEEMLCLKIGIPALRKAAFAHSVRPRLAHQGLASMFERYLPSHPLYVSAEALAIDFAGRVRAALPMTVIDPPYAPQRLKAPLMAAMERHGLAMEPIMRLHGDGPCLPSPSVIASASQLMAVLQKTGKQIADIEPLYEASVHGFAYTDMHDCVGDASCLLFLVRANGDAHGFFIDASLLPPPLDHLKQYAADVLIFKASGASQPTFQSPSVTSQCVTVLKADATSPLRAKVVLGQCHVEKWEGFLGLWAPSPSVLAAGVGCMVRVRWEGAVRSIPADEIEVLRLVVS